MAEEFATLFTRNSTLDPQTNYPPTILQVESTMTELVIKDHTIRHNLQGINVGKATGPNVIQPLVLETGTPEFTPILCKQLFLSITTKFIQKFKMEISYSLRIID